MNTKIRLATGVILTVVLLVVGFGMLNREPSVGGLLLAFAALRGSLVARQIYAEMTDTSLGN